MSLRDYQQKIYDDTRTALAEHKNVFVQSATGSGKTRIFAAMANSVHGKKKRAWIIVPRNELVKQASNHLLGLGVPHGQITAKSDESRAFKIHVVSKDTLIRRYDKIKNWPDLAIFDEGHLYLDRQIEIASHLPEHSKMIGFSATPERLDGRGLSELYSHMVEGPSIPWLTERGFLSQLRYFSPPLEGLQDLTVRGNDVDEEQLEDLLNRRKVYGELVGHYDKYGKGKAALIFCRSVKQAYQTAERFRDKGFNFHCIEGKLTDKKRRALIAALTAGDIDGLTNVDIATYGLDVPRVEYGASIRPTMSRALYFQIIGRIIRAYTEYHMKYNYKTGIYEINTNQIKYKKEEALFFDHVNLILEHQEPNYPGIPPHYVPEIKWNFHGTEKRKKEQCPKCRYIDPDGWCRARGEKLTKYYTRCDKFSPTDTVKLCPHLDFMYCTKKTCQGCQHNPGGGNVDQRQSIVVIPTDLKEINHKVKMSDLPPEEKREMQDRIGQAITEYRNDEIDEAVKKLLKIAEELGNNILWVYWKLSADMKTVNIPVLYAIQRHGKTKQGKPIKNGWAHFQKDKIRKELNWKQKELDDLAGFHI